jgi:hypothetical protein
LYTRFAFLETHWEMDGAKLPLLVSNYQLMFVTIAICLYRFPLSENMLIVYHSLIETFQQTSQSDWVPVYIYREPSTTLKLFILFFLTACSVAIVELFKAWRIAPPFRLSRQASNAAYPKLLEASGARLKQWIFFTLLTSGLCISLTLNLVCNRLMNVKVLGISTIIFILADYATVLTMTLFAILLLFLVRWHFIDRINYLRRCGVI